MYKIDLAYKKDTLHIYLDNIVAENHLQRLKQELYSLTEKYGITEIIIDIQHVKKLDRNCLCEMMDKYEIMYKNYIHLIDSVQAII